MAAQHLARLWTRLGIPADYAQRRHMPVQREAKKLVSIGRAADDGKRLRLTPSAARAWRQMRDAAAREGIQLLPISAFRSVRRQAKLIRTKLRAGESIGQVLQLVAAPGCSEHHTGRALDLASPADLELDADFARTREFRWLKRHAGKFGFVLSYPRGNRHGIGYEPWHWCWRGTKRVRRRVSRPTAA